jgi:phosphotransferase system  glucose/maltose/N-acetylglucosamine-specific IIC component
LGNHAGTFQAGFFPIFMFGLPALVLAIHRKALDTQKLKVLGLLGGSAVISFFTGITEPVEYAFLYAAPLLYGMHVILTGIFSFIVGAFGIQVGFAFSAGFIDYVLSIPKSFAIIHANYSGADAVMRNPL